MVLGALSTRLHRSMQVTEHCLSLSLLGSVAQLIGYALYSPAPPFPLFVIAFAFNGFGLALQVNVLPHHIDFELIMR